MNVRALQLGSIDYSQQYKMDSNVEWNYEPELDVNDLEYDIAFICRTLTDQEVDILTRMVRAHCLFILEDVKMNDKLNFLMKSRCGRKIADTDIETFLQTKLRDYYTVPYGEKFDPHSLTPAPDFHGKVYWHGYTEAVFEGNFGDKMKQAVLWRGNIPVEKDQAIDFWLEYETTGSVEIELQIVQFLNGSVSVIQNTWKFNEEDLKQPVTIDNDKESGPVFVWINAKGQGTLKIVSLHDRYSRHDAGAFLPGSRRIVTDNREEIFAYMDPGDLKPPLCVYFSGYKTMEGFEGYRMMRRKGCPFILISEPRLEGGAFYLGSQEYENKIKEVIEGYMTELDFTNNDVVFSGLSMGTFGAVYYGTMIRPAYIIVGKPVLSLGNMTAAERIDRPGVFPTAFDLMWKQYQSLDKEAIEKLNRHFWDKFDQTDWSDRTFCVAYMLEDDYDNGAYQNLLSHIKGSNAKVIGKGLHGRHNDDTSGIVSWFIRQYDRVLRDEYNRE